MAAGITDVKTGRIPFSPTKDVSIELSNKILEEQLCNKFVFPTAGVACYLN